MAFLSIPGDEEKRAQMSRSDPSAASEVGFLYRDSPGTRSFKKSGFLDDSKEYRNYPTPKRSHAPRSRRTTVLCIALLALAGMRFSKFEAASPTVDLKAAAWLASNSSENALKLVKLYPKLDENATDECKQAWERSTATLPCHHTILSAAFDNSNTTDAGAAGTDPFTSTKIVCEIQCARALSRSSARPFPRTNGSFQSHRIQS
jgi:hypothetical protein